MDVAFIVVRGTVFLDILGAFTIMGELGLPMRNKWKGVDALLQENGITHREAFRRYHKWTWTQRSHISLHAILVLTQQGLVKNKARRDALLRLFEHIEKEIDLLEERKQILLDEVDSLGDGLHEEKWTVDICEEKIQDDSMCNAGIEACNDACGRQYHFSVRCCKEDHAVEIAGKSIGYVISEDRVFLEKCTAFSALGRMYGHSLL